MYYLFCFYLDQSRLVLFPLDYVLYILEGFLFLMLMEYPFFGSNGHKNFGFFFFSFFFAFELTNFFCCTAKEEQETETYFEKLRACGYGFLKNVLI